MIKFTDIDLAGDLEPHTNPNLLDTRTVKGVYTQVHATGVAKLTFEEELPAGKATVRLPFQTTFNAEPDALTSMADSGAKYAWTQFGAISARRAFPSFDEPRFKTPYDTAEVLHQPAGRGIDEGTRHRHQAGE